MKIKVKISDKVIELYEQEIEKVNNGEVAFPRQVFGHGGSEYLYQIAKDYRNKWFEIVSFERNETLGRDFDLITIRYNELEVTFRRKWLEYDNIKDQIMNIIQERIQIYSKNNYPKLPESDTSEIFGIISDSVKDELIDLLDMIERL